VQLNTSVAFGLTVLEKDVGAATETCELEYIESLCILFVHHIHVTSAVSNGAFTARLNEPGFVEFAPLREGAACLVKNVCIDGRPGDDVSAAFGAACLGQNVLFVFGGPEGVVSAGAEDGLAEITDWEVMIDCNGCCGCPPAFAHRGVISEWPKFINKN